MNNKKNADLSLTELSELEYITSRFRDMLEKFMLQSAELIEAKDKLRRYKFVVDSLVEDRNHNKCHMRQRWVCEQICEIEGVPLQVPQDIPPEEMYYGCAVYIPEQYKNLTPTQKEMAKEFKAVAEKYLGLTPQQDF